MTLAQSVSGLPVKNSTKCELVIVASTMSVIHIVWYARCIRRLSRPVVVKTILNTSTGDTSLTVERIRAILIPTDLSRREEQIYREQNINIWDKRN